MQRYSRSLVIAIPVIRIYRRNSLNTNVQRVLVTLLLFLLPGTYCEAAVCELSCGLRQTSSSASTSNSTPPAEMHAGHCSGVTKAAVKRGKSPGLRSCRSRVCEYISGSAIETDPSHGAQFASVAWLVIGIVPPEPRLPGRGMVASKDPPPGRSSANPLLVSLRV